MPKQRIYTNEGFLEVQWDQTGNLVCVVSGFLTNETAGSPPKKSYDIHMHQFTSSEDDSRDLRIFGAAVRRAKVKNAVAAWHRKNGDPLPEVNQNLDREPTIVIKSIERKIKEN